MNATASLLADTICRTVELGVTITDPAGRIVYTNPAEARMHGYELGELLGRDARILGPPESGRRRSPVEHSSSRSWTRETVNVRKDGSRFDVLLWSDVVVDEQGETIGMVTCCEDITDRKSAEAALREVAMRDPLTGLPNRDLLLDRLAHARVVERDAVARELADAVPVAALEARLRLLRDVARQRVVPIEAGEHRLRDRRRPIDDRLVGGDGAFGVRCVHVLFGQVSFAAAQCR